MTAYRAIVKKPNELIRGYVMFRINNVLLTFAQVARSQWTSQRVGGKLCGRGLDNPGRFKLTSETERRETRSSEYVQNISGIVRNQLDTNDAVLTRHNP
ncbi:hypothetical protein E8F11_28310 [Pseudomonas sp. BN417]|nr:hypothetical protein [Pseudomonas sp. BN417]